MRKTYNIFFVICLAVLLIMSCSNINNRSAVLNPDELIFKEKFEDQLTSVMLDYASIEKKSAAEMAAIFDFAKEQFENGNGTDHRLRYSLLLTLPNQKFYDREKALTLLKEWPETERLPQTVNSFRKILLMRLEEEQHLKKSVNHLYHQLENEKMKYKMLQKKVDDIKDMEKSLIRRNLP